MTASEPIRSGVERQNCAVVVGGSRGIGRAICSAIAPAYSNIAILYRENSAAAEATARDVAQRGANPLLHRTDIREPTSTESAAEHVRSAVGRIDLLVHSAGGASSWKSVRELTYREWTDLIDVDLNGFFNVVSPVLRIMHEQRAGSIIAISSIAARACSPRSSQTAAAKAGLEAMVRVIAREEGRYGIRANAVSVGLTETDLGRDAVRHWGDAFTQTVIAQSALKRIGRPEDVADVVAF